MAIAFPDLLVLRHGETEWNVEGRLQGALDSALTDLGQSQARKQAEILGAMPLSGWTWYSSPQPRARTTAEIARGGSVVAIREDTRLREIGMGQWTGTLRKDIAATHPTLFDGPPLGWYEHAPDGEGIAALAARVADFSAELPGPSVIVTHGITSRVLRCLALGLPASDFATVGGGQGVVYQVSNRVSTMLEAPLAP